MGPLTTQSVGSDAGQWAISAVEGWRGEILYVVMAAEEGRFTGVRSGIRRLCITSHSVGGAGEHRAGFSVDQ